MFLFRSVSLGKHKHRANLLSHHQIHCLLTLWQISLFGVPCSVFLLFFSIYNFFFFFGQFWACLSQASFRCLSPIFHFRPVALTPWVESANSSCICFYRGTIFKGSQISVLLVKNSFTFFANVHNVHNGINGMFNCWLMIIQIGVHVFSISDFQ